jgi:hypothetical protein
MAVGDDNLFHEEKYKWSLTLTAINLTNKYALYNFLSTFSGTHYVTPRALTAELGFLSESATAAASLCWSNGPIERQGAMKSSVGTGDGPMACRSSSSRQLTKVLVPRLSGPRILSGMGNASTARFPIEEWESLGKLPEGEGGQ